MRVIQRTHTWITQGVVYIYTDSPKGAAREVTLINEKSIKVHENNSMWMPVWFLYVTMMCLLHKILHVWMSRVVRNKTKSDPDSLFGFFLSFHSVIFRSSRIRALHHQITMKGALSCSTECWPLSNAFLVALCLRTLSSPCHLPLLWLMLSFTSCFYSF